MGADSIERDSLLPALVDFNVLLDFNLSIILVEHVERRA